MDKSSQIAYFDSVATEWDTLMPLDPARLRTLLGLCEIPAGARVLDVGCGTAAFAPLLLEKEPSSVLCVDFSERMLEQARERCADPRVELRRCDVMELGGEEFDCAIILGSFIYFENRGSLLRQMRHLLVPGGRLMICHAQGRTTVNSHHAANAAQLAMPLPAAHILSSSLDQNFDVDMVVDTPSLYAVSGLRRI